MLCTYIHINVAAAASASAQESLEIGSSTYILFVVKKGFFVSL